MSYRETDKDEIIRKLEADLAAERARKRIEVPDPGWMSWTRETVRWLETAALAFGAVGFSCRSVKLFEDHQMRTGPVLGGLGILSYWLLRRRLTGRWFWR